MRHTTRFTLVMLLVLPLLLALASVGRTNTATAAAPTAVTANDLRLSQVYGGGGNPGAPYTHDFIEIFNAGTSSVSLDGLSLQYTSATGTGNFGSSATQLTELPNVMLAPGQYYLVQQASGANGVALPTPDHIDPTPINMSGTSGKVVLVTGITSLGCNGGSNPCDADQLARIIDLVGFGTANFFEGSAAAPALSNTTAALRADNGCTDTDDNAADFTAVAPAPRNSASPSNPCVTEAVLELSKTAHPASPFPGDPVTYTIVATNSGTVADTAVVLTDTLPADNEFTTWLLQPAGATENLGTISWNGTLSVSESITFSFVVTNLGKSNTAVTNTATISGTDNSATAQASYTVAASVGDVTFVYHDLEDVVLPGEYIFLAGNFNGFDNTALTMTADANNEVFTATVPAVSGLLDYKYVVDVAGTKEWDWLNSANRTYQVVGDATVNDYRNITSGYARLNTAGPLNTRANIATDAIYGETYFNNVTNPAGAARGLVAEVGYGNNTNLNSWAWFPTTFNTQNGNNDEFGGPVTPTAVGTYSYTIRFNGNSGTGNPNSNWVYADTTGVGPYPGGDFSFSDLGVLNVAAPACGDPATLISAIQGSGASSPILGQNVTVEAVVVSNFQGGSGTLNGFHLQEEADDHDGDPLTSEGLFVFNNNSPIAVAVGDLVRIQGTVGEFQSATQLANVTATVICSSGNVITPTLITLPLAEGVTWERYEGMLLQFNDVVATDNFRLGRFGQVRMATHRLAQPTNVVAPGAEANALQALNNRSYITLDDARTFQNADPMIYPAPELSYTNTLRGGDVVTQMIGVIDHFTGSNGGDPYRLQPTQPVNFVATNLRQANPPDVGGTVQVASFNVLNYFSTLDGNGNICGPLANQGCRGADSALEFERQYTKIVNAIVGMDTAVVGLMEIENHATDAAVMDLVTRLNAVAGAGVYDYIATGPIGGDAIKQAIIYQPTLVTPVGDYAILDSSDDPRFDDTLNRPVIIQTFAENSSGVEFTVAVNHLKSKGSACPGDPDVGDGQGNCNITRTEAAQALVDYLADPANGFSPYTLIIGDLNAYAMEDPIMAIQDAGYTNLVSQFGGEDAYGYQFDGQWGYLDHALANNDLLPFVTGTSDWHINADEPIVLDYNTEFKSARHIDLFFGPSAFRSSDHDPVIVGLDFQVEPTDPSALRLSQIYGGGGNSGATFTHDYIEIFNSGTISVSLNGLSLQYASATGTGNIGANENLVTALPNVMLLPGQYYLVQQASNANVGDPLPTPDLTGTIAMGGTGGKVVLVTGTSSLGCNGSTTVCDETQLARIIDLVGYGSANFFEGTAPAPTLSSTLAAFRAGDGCVDTDDNGADFSALLPAPRNTSTPLHSCELVVLPTVVSSTPITGAVDVPVTTTLSVTFSEVVSVTAVWFDLSCTVGGNNLPATYDPAGPATSYTITPNSPLAHDDTCTLTVLGDQVQNAQNGTMAADYLVTFDTATAVTPPTPTIAIPTPSAGEIFTVSVGQTTVAIPFSITTTNFSIPTDGHWHWYLDGVHQGPVFTYDTTINLPVGEYVLEAELHTPTHTPLGITATVSIEVVPEQVVVLPPPAPVVTAPLTGTEVLTQPTFMGTAEAGATIIITDEDGEPICETVADAVTGAWSCTPEAGLPLGTQTFSVVARNSGGDSPAVLLTLTVVAPPAAGFTLFLPLIQR